MTTTDSSTVQSPVHIVIQRYRTCRLLVNEQDWISVDTAGVLVYVSFAATADLKSVHSAAETILNLPVLTDGVWGDGSKLKSIRDIISGKATDAAVSITIVPQANLISKLKGQGKSIQYHGQIEKSKGNELYDFFLDSIRATVVKLRQEELTAAFVAWNTTREQLMAQTLDPSIPETQVFRLNPAYGSFDETGFPLTTSDGEVLTKSSGKKLRNVYESHAKRHAKWTPPVPVIPQWDAWLEGSVCAIVAGSFGKRQGLEITSDMGPFCHVLTL